jgi:UDP-N-acetylmuramyl pentapeptide phosphotransferase/UDP-N-acetylglucosamine-1-phosphate transferase
MRLTIQIYPILWQIAFTLTITYLLSKSFYWIGGDSDLGVQKHHLYKVSRLGGLGVALSILSGGYFIREYYPNVTMITYALMFCYSPIFFAGLFEDITHKVSPSIRFSFACVSAIAIIFLTKIQINYTDIDWIDSILKIYSISFILTMIIIVGFVNSINIIDGFHGVASGATLIMLITFAFITYSVEDYLIFHILLVIIIANTCFILLNWPFGKIFLGDSGAYLLGIWVVVIGILIPSRSTTISPMATVLIGTYPMIETIFSIYRRMFIRKTLVSKPDALHLHTLIYKRLIYKTTLPKNAKKNIHRNAMVALFIWPIFIIDSIIAIIFINNTEYLVGAIIMNFIVYFILYSKLIKFKINKIFNLR